MGIRTRDPQTLGAAGVLDRMARILAARNIDPACATDAADESQSHLALAAAESRIPPMYRAALADHPRVAAWTRQVAAQAASPSRGARRQVATGPSLLLAGVTGCGKTHQAYGAVRSLVQAGIGVRWQAITAADLYARLRPRPDTDSERELAVIARCPLLIIDDLGAAKASEWTEEVTYRVINHRYQEMLPTLVTTNLPIKDLRGYLGDRVTSRLAQMTERVEFAPVDRRRHRAA